MTTSTPRAELLTVRKTLLFALMSQACFHAAYLVPSLAALIAVAMYGFYRLAYVPSTRMSLYGGIAMGMLVFGPHLWWFFPLFGPGAILLWMAMGLSLALFLLFSRWAVGELPAWLSPWVIPFLWTGVEFFRCELNPLKFAWLMPAWVFDHCPMFLPMQWVGAYGLGFLMMLACAVLSRARTRVALPVGVAAMLALGVLTNLPNLAPDWRGLNAPLAEQTPQQVREALQADATAPAFRKLAPGKEDPIIVCVQREEPLLSEVLADCDAAVARFPSADIISFSEYTLAYQPHQELLDWCRTNQRYVILGGTKPIPEQEKAFYNMAYVIGPNGIEHEQPKSVPVQFMNDGTPAPTRSVWLSPWGPVGLCICYDMSYARVMDDFVRQGARLLIVPTMDRRNWSEYEHRIHAKVTPVRAAEYGVPIVRPCSSGIS